VDYFRIKCIISINLIALIIKTMAKRGTSLSSKLGQSIHSKKTKKRLAAKRAMIEKKRAKKCK
jgi:hypothetical protein